MNEDIFQPRDRLCCVSETVSLKHIMYSTRKDGDIPTDNIICFE